MSLRRAAIIQMTANLPQTSSKLDGPLVKQFSVFLPNKVGAMLEIVKLLSAHHTHVVALSVSESTDSAIARIIASDPQGVEKLFRENNVGFGVVSESTDSAIARIIASDPQGVEKLFRENNVGFGVSQVVVVEMREVATQLVKLLAALVMAEVNVHFAYPLLIRPRGFSAIALHVDDTDCASSVLMGEGFKLLSQDDITR